MLDLLQVHVQFVHPQSGALAHGGELCGLAVGVGQAGHVLVLVGKLGQVGQGADDLLVHQFQALAHDDHVGVVTHIAAGGAQMDDALGVGALQAVGIDVAHHVMTDQLFPGGSLFVVDVVLVGFQLGDLLVGDVQALLLLGFGQGNPQTAPGAELVVIGKNILHLVRSIPGGEGRDITIMCHERFSLSVGGGAHYSLK